MKRYVDMETGEIIDAVRFHAMQVPIAMATRASPPRRPLTAQPSGERRAGLANFANPHHPGRRTLGPGTTAAP
ncbi:hypothetical protein GCM10010347_64260 [Streptomyces cirratus]|uniref:Uncharacterized protein n=1 Tax=Streptomyces cirratus TaxID=68187 RepID=A0ABQ3F2A4_9ACTN|nr:hypothetical protein GCM10010347_64260 [Streptomyces cirratus]